MNSDFLIVGQGVCGSWLSWWLKQMGCSVLVIDAYRPDSPSRVAAGIINPVTGRRHVSTWKAETLLPFALEQYQQFGNELGVKGISEKTLIDFFPSAQMRISFQKRVEEKGEYVQMGAGENEYRHSFHYDLGYGMIRPTYTAHLENILPAWRKQLLATGGLLEENFDKGKLQLEKNGVRYENIQASTLVFCDGAAGTEDPWFGKLPYAVNKGEIITVRIPGLDAGHIYKRSLSLVPLAEKDHWWIGSNYGWELEPVEITENFRIQVESLLSSWLKLPYSIIDHKIALRPANIERRPFVGRHPAFPSLAILNGMGSKGSSLAPWFAKQLAEHLVNGTPIDPEASTDRFRNILSR